MQVASRLWASRIARIAENQVFLVKHMYSRNAKSSASDLPNRRISGIRCSWFSSPPLIHRRGCNKESPKGQVHPSGQRGFGSPSPMDRFHAGLKAGDYLQQANGAILTMVQIETKRAMENVNATAATPGIDVLFVGPFDLGIISAVPLLAA